MGDPTSQSTESGVITVKDVYSHGLVTCKPETMLTEVARLLTEAEVSAVVVVDDEGQLAGIISQFDLLEHYGEDLEAAQAQDIMVTPVEGVYESDALELAIQKMRAFHFHRLVVLGAEPRRAVGVIAVADVISWMRRPAPQSEEASPAE